MQKLHLVGFTADLDGLIFSLRRGAKSGAYRVELDDSLLGYIEEALRLRATGAGDDDDEAEAGSSLVSAGPPAAPPPPVAASSRSSKGGHGATSSALSVREIQARLRSGHTVAEIAHEAGVDEDWINRFAAPVLAEQEMVVDSALPLVYEAPRKGDSSQPLGQSVRWNLVDRGVRFDDDAFRSCWSAYQAAPGRWVVRFEYATRGRTERAEWEIDAETSELTPRSRLAGELAYVEHRRPRPDDDGEDGDFADAVEEPAELAEGRPTTPATPAPAELIASKIEHAAAKVRAAATAAVAQRTAASPPSKEAETTPTVGRPAAPKPAAGRGGIANPWRARPPARPADNDADRDADDEPTRPAVVLPIAEADDQEPEAAEPDEAEDLEDAEIDDEVDDEQDEDEDAVDDDAVDEDEVAEEHEEEAEDEEEPEPEPVAEAEAVVEPDDEPELPTRPRARISLPGTGLANTRVPARRGDSPPSTSTAPPWVRRAVPGNSLGQSPPTRFGPTPPSPAPSPRRPRSEPAPAPTPPKPAPSYSAPTRTRPTKPEPSISPASVRQREAAASTPPPSRKPEPPLSRKPEPPTPAPPSAPASAPLPPRRPTVSTPPPASKPQPAPSPPAAPRPSPRLERPRAARPTEVEPDFLTPEPLIGADAANAQDADPRYLGGPSGPPIVVSRPAPGRSSGTPRNGAGRTEITDDDGLVVPTIVPRRTGRMVDTPAGRRTEPDPDSVRPAERRSGTKPGPVLIIKAPRAGDDDDAEE